MREGRFPDLSIVVLTYNRAGLLMECIDSLLRQTAGETRYEVIVVDDGSEDDTPERMAERCALDRRLRYVRQPHRGIPATRNNGIRHARAPIVAIVADDYRMAPDYVKTVMTFFRVHPAARVVRFKIVPASTALSSRISHFYYEISFLNRLHPVWPGRTFRERVGFYFRRLPQPPDTITHDHELEAAGAAAFCREVFEVVGAFDETLQRGEDTDMTRRLKAHGIPIYYVPHHQVRHQYRRGCMDTVLKCFLSGVHRYGLHAKYGAGKSHHKRAGYAVRFVIEQMFRGVWRARQARNVKQFLWYLPFMMLFETAVKMGFLFGAMRAKWRGGTTSSHTAWSAPCRREGQGCGR